MGLKTIVLKLYKPGREKRRIINEAIINYNHAFGFLLEKAYSSLKKEPVGDIGDISERRSPYFASTLSKNLVREYTSQLNNFDIQPFKDSLEMDLSMTLAGYLKLKTIKHNTGFPLVSVRQSAAEGKLRPVYFCRYDVKRNYCLLYDCAKDRYYVKLYLMNNKNARAVNPEGKSKQRLVYVYKTFEAVNISKRKEPYIIVPLSFGKYQEKILKEAMKNPAILRTAKLKVKGDEYYLAVSVDTGEKEKVYTDTFLGVSRGLKDNLSYAVTDLKGSILSSGSIPVKVSHRKGPLPLNELHILSNAIVKIAKEYKSQVILQNLLDKGDRLEWNKEELSSNRVFSFKAYIKIIRLLEYKLPEEGLPQPVKVSPVDIFYRCHMCNSYSIKNRLNQETFICVRCGASIEIERLGSLNLSRKLTDYSASTIKIKVASNAEGVWLTNNLIGLKLFVPHTKNPMEELKAEIENIIENFKGSNKNFTGKERLKRLSIIKKFTNSKDFMEIIEFV
ncbi:hypothetical protein OXPF_02190 [Oxobacter pfennigii]|uniref:Transposase DNA-binding domain protein n=1 Tax=Oxobacter pfennigii TaxID=36849 RepID=A0A0P8WBT1_9CLOT|nr:hypothetical protein [Oxobacter pfennigii]KPU46109.1 hypothetical protein OXPF_02190 [Oxobacter pfennigii]